MSSTPLLSSSSNGFTVQPPYCSYDTDPVDWIKDFDRIVKANEWSDARALDVAALYVNEVCKVLLFQNKNPKDHAEFKKLFLEHYQNDEYKTRNYNAAHNYRQPDDETADAFIVKMMRWFERASIEDDATRCRLFSNAANESVLRALLRKSPKTFADMITLTQAEVRLR
ncbi:hypothetical protein BGZ82_000175 [Podila clonocystis]|nr:hypothetical protein BGZ82_000175 [Podila clonocystis]